MNLKEHEIKGMDVLPFLFPMRKSLNNIPNSLTYSHFVYFVTDGILNMFNLQ